MKKFFKLLGLIAMVAVIGFSFAACRNGSTDDGGSGGGGLSAPALSVAATSSEIYLSWTAVGGASGYRVYASYSASSGFVLADTTTATSTFGYNANPSTTYYFYVAAYDSRGEGPRSNVASVTTSSNYVPNPNPTPPTPTPPTPEPTFPTTTFDGVWQAGSGQQVTVSGSTGTITVMGTLDTLWKDAYDKGYLYTGITKWRNLRNTGNLTWSGDNLLVSYNSSRPNVATGVTYWSCTITMSADGRTAVFTGSDSRGSTQGTYTRIR